MEHFIINVADPDPVKIRIPVRISERQCSGSGSTYFWASRIRILLSSYKNSKKNLDYLYLTFDRKHCVKN
jgi:hypothetical protein